MYTFNNFEYETYAEELLPKVVSEKETYIKLIQEVLDSYDKLDEKEHKIYEFIEEAIGYSTMGAYLSGFFVSIAMGKSIGEIAATLLAITGASLVGQLSTTGVCAAIYVKGRNKIAKKAYDTIVYNLNETIKNGTSLSIDQIHEMKESLANGELSDKRNYIATEGKFGIDMLTIDDETNRVYEDVDDATVLRAYEVVAYIIMQGYEGYEEDVLMAYDLIKSYVHDKKTGNLNFETRPGYEERFAYLENQLHKSVKSK